MALGDLACAVCLDTLPEDMNHAGHGSLAGPDPGQISKSSDNCSGQTLTADLAGPFEGPARHALLVG